MGDARISKPREAKEAILTPPHMSDDLKLRQKNQGYGRRYFIIGSGRSKGSEKGPEIKRDPGIS